MSLNIGVITLFPEMFQALHYGVVGRAIESKQVTLHFFNPRDYATDNHHTVDDRPYGGGPGMVMRYAPLAEAMHSAQDTLGKKIKRIHLTPQGQVLTQEALLTHFANLDTPLLLVAGRYEGIDERFIEEYIDEEWSVGDYVLSGGELPAMSLIDALTRLLPEALGNPESAAEDSFSTGLLDYPHYTRPSSAHGHSVPSVLLSGDHQAILRWRLKIALGRTWQRRPDLLKRRSLTEQEQQLLNEFIKEHGNNGEPYS
jgi:tRNA (guanine37-N1)-methyltransferase